jgi:acetamidase/formamidase
MPYYIQKDNAGCDTGDWATTKGDGEVMGCHDTKEAAIRQMVALSVAEGIEPGGERGADD